MSDYIKREDAINQVLGLTMLEGRVPIDSVIFNIKQIPSADVVEREAYEDLKEAYDTAQHYALERKAEQTERSE